MSNQYFDADPVVPSEPRTISLALPDLTVELRTDAGVFSGDRVDAGTKYLLLEVPPPADTVRDVLDLGCGYGPIALTLARRAPQAAVWAVDTNTRAVALCNLNAARGAMANIHASVVSDDQPDGDVPDDVTFDLIWSNPPIRIGKPALHALLRHWLDRLAEGGHAYLVVQKHLGSDSLQQWLVAEGWPTERLGSRAGYRILDVAARSRASDPS